MLEVFLLVVIFTGFYSENQVNQSVKNNNNDKEVMKDLKGHKKINAENLEQFEIINKKGVWVFAPVQTRKTKNLRTRQEPLSEFIVLPDGSKIEKGL